MKRSEMRRAADRALEFYEKAGIALTEAEKASLEVADFGLNRLEQMGLELITYVNTQRVCAKEMVLFPGQTCPEHRHVGQDGLPGKEETFRCRFGTVYLYVEGEGERDKIAAALPETDVTVFHEIILTPGRQYTIFPGTRHWFQGGGQGAVVSEFSTRSSDETDVFTDARIQRMPQIDEDA